MLWSEQGLLVGELWNYFSQISDWDVDLNLLKVFWDWLLEFLFQRLFGNWFLRLRLILMLSCFGQGLFRISVKAKDMENAFLILCELKDHCIYKRWFSFQITFPPLQYSLNISWYNFNSAVMALTTFKFLSFQQSFINKPEIKFTASNKLSQIKSKTELVPNLVPTSLDWIPTPFN